MRKIKSFLLMNGTPYRGRWTLKDLETLKEVDSKVAGLVRLIESFNAEIKLVTKEVGKISRNGRRTSLLQTVPGIGEFSSLMIVAEIADIKRFSNPKSLVSYAGLCPGIHQSASKSHPVLKKACNKWLKWVMTECSGRAVMMNNRYMRHFYRVKKRKGFKTARRSVARKMLTDVWHILTKEEPYRDHGPSSEGQEHPQPITRR
ncbi:MAG: transposase [Methanopyri archaeon]|nr:transposase [Methanopyri archaeon]